MWCHTDNFDKFCYFSTQGCCSMSRIFVVWPKLPGDLSRAAILFFISSRYRRLNANLDKQYHTYICI
jgi:hypothetical protein